MQRASSIARAKKNLKFSLDCSENPKQNIILRGLHEMREYFTMEINLHLREVEHDRKDRQRDVDDHRDVVGPLKFIDLKPCT